MTNRDKSTVLCFQILTAGYALMITAGSVGMVVSAVVLLFAGNAVLKGLGVIQSQVTVGYIDD